MYGLINNALQDMVVAHFGERQWTAICADAGLPDETFLTMRRYDDEITFRLARAAAKVLNTPIDDCMVLFGRHWVSAIAARRFAALMDVTGSDTLSFLRNVNALHDRITTTFIDYVPPEFDLEEIDSTGHRYLVHYYSERKGLSAFVTGLLIGLAEHFGDKLEIHDIAVDESGSGTHSQYQLTLR